MTGIYLSSLLLMKYLPIRRSLTLFLTEWLKEAHEGIDFPGSDIRYELMDDAETCQTTCTQDANCQFYTYVTKNFHSSVHWYSILFTFTQTV